MWLQRRVAIALVAVMLLPVAAVSDPGKNESGKGRRHHHAESLRKQQEHRQKARKKSVERQRKQMEKRREARQRAREKAREHRGRQQERYWENAERLRERRRESWEHGSWEQSRRHGGSFHSHDLPLPPPGNFVEPYHRHDDHRYGPGLSYTPAPTYAPLPSYPGDYRRRSGYGYPRRYEDDLDAVYTPFGFYEEYPRSAYRGYGPAPTGYGRIGPYRFEVWED